MKKFIKNNMKLFVFILIIGAICICETVVATNYLVKNITYTQ